jgi:hypothetical protein
MNCRLGLIRSGIGINGVYLILMSRDEWDLITTTSTSPTIITTTACTGIIK